LFTLLDVSLWGQFIYIGIYGVLGDCFHPNLR
jgi:hypothetical protein